MINTIGKGRGRGRYGVSAKIKAVLAFIFIFVITYNSYAEQVQEPQANFQPSGPLNIRNQMPLYVFYISPTPDKAQTLKKGKFAVETSYHVSNTIIDQHPIWPCQTFGNRRGLEAREWYAHIDTEVNRIGLNISYGLLDALELTADIPYYMFSKGFLDGFIENFENNFSFIKTPNARKESPRYHYDYRLYNRGNDIIQSGSAPNDFGEISAYLKYRFFDETKLLPTASLRGGIKLPSTRDNLLGSKKTDFSLGILLDKKITDRFFMYFNFNWALLQKPNILSELDVFNEQMYHGMIALEYFLTNKTSMIFQATANTHLYDKGIPCTGNDPVVLTLGFNHNFNNAISWQIAMDENTNSAAPDFGLFTSLKIKT